MEFLRFGSSIPGSYWGCCAVCIIQNFKVDPDAKASIQLVDGDGGFPLSDKKGFLFAGPTYRDIFWQRLRYGTFGSADMPNHAFLATLTASQIAGGYGKKWLAILKEAGFEFIRTVDNSVYTGAKIISGAGEVADEVSDEDDDWDDDDYVSSHPNYLFGLFRNVGTGAVADPYLPPKAWTDLPEVVPELWQQLPKEFDGVKYNAEVQNKQLPLYTALPKKQFLSEKELEEKGVPVTYAGIRSKFSQQEKKTRIALQQSDAVAKKSPKKADPFGQAASAVLPS